MQKEKLLLFDIPIYYCSEKNHSKKWENKQNEVVSTLIRKYHTPEEAQHTFNRIYRYEKQWKFHKIVGYISIYYDFRCNDLKYSMWLSPNKKNRYDKIFRQKYDYISFQKSHDFVGDKSNKEINKLIQFKVNYIQTELLKNNYYIDLEYYNNISSYINFNDMFNKKGLDSFEI